jgi:hypothetical protein
MNPSIREGADMSDNRDTFGSSEVAARLGEVFLPTSWSNAIVCLLVPFSLSVAVVVWAESRSKKNSDSIFIGAAIAGLIGFVAWGSTAAYLYFNAAGKTANLWAGSLLLLLVIGVAYGILVSIASFTCLVLSAVVFQSLHRLSWLISPKRVARTNAHERAEEELVNVSRKAEGLQRQLLQMERDHALEISYITSNAIKRSERSLIKLFEMLLTDEYSETTALYLVALQSYQRSKRVAPVPAELLREVLLLHKDYESKFPDGISAETVRQIMEHINAVGGFSIENNCEHVCKSMVDLFSRCAEIEETQRFYEEHRCLIESHFSVDEYRHAVGPLGFDEEEDVFRQRHKDVRSHIQSLVACAPPAPPTEMQSVISELREFAREMLEECDAQDGRHPQNEAQHRHNAKVCLQQLKQRIEAAAKLNPELPQDSEIERNACAFCRFVAEWTYWNLPTSSILAHKLTNA